MREDRTHIKFMLQFSNILWMYRSNGMNSVLWWMCSFSISLCCIVRSTYLMLKSYLSCLIIIQNYQIPCAICVKTQITEQQGHKDRWAPTMGSSSHMLLWFHTADKRQAHTSWLSQNTPKTKIPQQQISKNHRSLTFASARACNIFKNTACLKESNSINRPPLLCLKWYLLFSILLWLLCLL